MPRTVVGLFPNPEAADHAITALEGLGLRRNEIQTLQEPESFDVTGIMSFPRIEYETSIARTLQHIGASPSDADAYVRALRDGGVVIFATDEDTQTIDAAAQLLDRLGAEKSALANVPAPHLPAAHHEDLLQRQGRSVSTGRIRQSGEGARVFVW